MAYQRGHAAWRSRERKEQWVRKLGLDHTRDWGGRWNGASAGAGNEWPGRPSQNQQDTVAEVAVRQGGERGSLV